jgi:hypothetical protein
MLLLLPLDNAKRYVCHAYNDANICTLNEVNYIRLIKSNFNSSRIDIYIHLPCCSIFHSTLIKLSALANMQHTRSLTEVYDGGVASKKQTNTS